ncbi:MAG: hypothetical protein AABY22_06440 [Nanoarchaeota archaeon]
MKNKTYEIKTLEDISNCVNVSNSAVLHTRSKPCLCVTCHECGAVFMATALKEEYHTDSDANKELLNDITGYARQGFSVAFKDATEFKLDYCGHLNSR